MSIWKNKFSKNSIYLFIYLSTDANAISSTDRTDLNQLYRWMGNCFMYPNMYMYSGTPPIRLNNRELFEQYTAANILWISKSVGTNQHETEFKEFEPRLKFMPRLNYV